MAKKKYLTVKEITKLVGNPKTAEQALVNLDNLLSASNVWVKGAEAKNLIADEYFNKGKKEIEMIEQDVSDLEKGTMFCLRGAVKRIDGPTENEVMAAIGFALPDQYFIDDVLCDLDDAPLDFVFDCKYYVDDSYSYIAEFNDDDETTLKDIKSVIARAKKNIVIFKEIQQAIDTLHAAEDMLVATVKQLQPPVKVKAKKRK